MSYLQHSGGGAAAVQELLHVRRHVVGNPDGPQLPLLVQVLQRSPAPSTVTCTGKGSPHASVQFYNAKLRGGRKLWRRLGCSTPGQKVVGSDPNVRSLTCRDP